MKLWRDTEKKFLERGLEYDYTVSMIGLGDDRRPYHQPPNLKNEDDRHSKSEIPSLYLNYRLYYI
jgi:hypothetical protein